MRTIWLPSVDSTNLEARRRWDAGESLPFALAAGIQTAGIGRDGRLWQSPHGGIWTTLAWPLTRPLAHYLSLPLVVGSVVAESISSHTAGAVDAQLKWPNDLLVHERKLAGILCQGDSALRPPGILIGIGINGDYAATAVDGATRTPVTTLREELGPGAPLDLPTLLASMLDSLASAIMLYEQHGFAPWHERINDRLAWRGQAIQALDREGDAVAGVLDSLDDAGRVILRTRSGQRRAFVSGEISRLRAAI